VAACKAYLEDYRSNPEAKGEGLMEVESNPDPDPDPDPNPDPNPKPKVEFLPLRKNDISVGVYYIV